MGRWGSWFLLAFMASASSGCTSNPTPDAGAIDAGASDGGAIDAPPLRDSATDETCTWNYRRREGTGCDGDRVCKPDVSWSEAEDPTAVPGRCVEPCTYEWSDGPGSWPIGSVGCPLGQTCRPESAEVGGDRLFCEPGCEFQSDCPDEMSCRYARLPGEEPEPGRDCRPPVERCDTSETDGRCFDPRRACVGGRCEWLEDGVARYCSELCSAIDECGLDIYAVGGVRGRGGLTAWGPFHSRGDGRAVTRPLEPVGGCEATCRSAPFARHVDPGFTTFFRNAGVIDWWISGETPDWESVPWPWPYPDPVGDLPALVRSLGVGTRCDLFVGAWNWSPGEVIEDDHMLTGVDLDTLGPAQWHLDRPADEAHCTFAADAFEDVGFTLGRGPYWVDLTPEEPGDWQFDDREDFLRECTTGSALMVSANAEVLLSAFTNGSFGDWTGLPEAGGRPFLPSLYSRHFTLNNDFAWPLDVRCDERGRLCSCTRFDWTDSVLREALAANGLGRSTLECMEALTFWNDGLTPDRGYELREECLWRLWQTGCEGLDLEACTQRVRDCGTDICEPRRCGECGSNGCGEPCGSGCPSGLSCRAGVCSEAPPPPPPESELPPGCSSDGACDDGDACTVDRCTSGECTNASISGCGGSSGGSGTCVSRNDWIDVEVRSGTSCGSPSSMSVTFTNRGSATVRMRWCWVQSSGRCVCGADNAVQPGRSTWDWTCDAGPSRSVRYVAVDASAPTACVLFDCP